MNVIALVVSFVLFLGGLALMGVSFTLPGGEAFAFVAGILCMALSFGLPIHLLSKFD